MNTLKIKAAILSLVLLIVPAHMQALSGKQAAVALLIAANVGVSIWQEELPENANWWQRNITGNVSQKEQYVADNKIKVRWTPAHGIIGKTLSKFNQYKEPIVATLGTYAVLTQLNNANVKAAFSTFAKTAETFSLFAANHAHDAVLNLGKLAHAIHHVAVAAKSA